MALNIPMPQLPGQALMEGLNTGGQLFSRIMNPIIQREQLAETGKYHQGTLEHYREQLAQQARHQAEQMDLARQAEGRMAANAKLERQLAGLKLQKLMRETDPAKQVAYIKQLLQASHSGHPMNQGQTQNPMQQFSGQGMPSVDGMEHPTIQAPSLETIQNGLANLSPEDQMILGMSGIKIPKISQTPEQKNAAALELFRQKEKIKNEKEEKMSSAIRTLHENIIHLSPKAIKAIDHIIDIPSPTEVPGLGFIKSGQKAAHNKAVTAAAENYSKANGWPNTKGSIEKAESILKRGNFETDYDYHKRLRALQDELRSGIKSSNEFLHPNLQQNEPNVDNDPLGIR